MMHRHSADIPMRRRTTSASAVVVAAALGATLSLSACSSSTGSHRSAGGTGSTQTGGQSAQQAVTGALGNLGKEASIKLTLSLPLSTTQIQQLGGAGGTSTTTMPQAQAAAIHSGSIFLSLATGHGEALDSSQAASDTANSFEIGLSTDGNTPVDVRYVGQALYVQANIAQLLSDVGQANSATAGKVTSTLQAADQYVPGLAALGQGKWVEISKSSIQSLEPLIKQMQQGAQSPAGGTTATTLSAAQARSAVSKLEADLKTALSGNVTYAHLGTANGRTEYSATVNISNFVNTLLPTLQNDLSAVPGVGSIAGSRLGKAKSSIPVGQTAVVDLYVADNKVSEADLDVTQFMKTNKPSFPVPLRLAAGSPGSVAAPPNPTALDLSRLPTLLQALIGSVGTKISSPPSASSTSG